MTIKEKVLWVFDRLLTYGIAVTTGYWFGASPHERYTAVGALTMGAALAAVSVYERELVKRREAAASVRECAHVTAQEVMRRRRCQAKTPLGLCEQPIFTDEDRCDGHDRETSS